MEVLGRLLRGTRAAEYLDGDFRLEVVIIERPTREIRRPERQPEPVAPVDHDQRVVKTLAVGAVPEHADPPASARDELARHGLIGNAESARGRILVRIENEAHADAAPGG